MKSCFIELNHECKADISARRERLGQDLRGLDGLGQGAESGLGCWVADGRKTPNTLAPDQPLVTLTAGRRAASAPEHLDAQVLA
ncbi:MAG: hypothetical protein AAGA75_00520 [Cyanobacteria bacterium P01_E01_bin.6]